MMGHSSMTMVDRVYGKLDEASYRRAIAKMPAGTVSSGPTQDPDCHAGVTSIARNRGEHGADGTTTSETEIADPVEESAIYCSSGVRAEGLEPSTSGLRVRTGYLVVVA
jgi:hypothetical protein